MKIKKIIISVVCSLLAVVLVAVCYFGGVAIKTNFDNQMQEQYQAGYDSRDAEIDYINADRAEQVAALNAQIMTLQEQLDNAVDPDEITAIKSQIAELQSQMEELQQGGGSSATQSLYMHSITLEPSANTSNKFRIYVNLLLNDATPLTKEDFIANMANYTNKDDEIRGGVIANGVYEDVSVTNIVYAKKNGNCFLIYNTMGTGSVFFMQCSDFNLYNQAIVKVL